MNKLLTLVDLQGQLFTPIIIILILAIVFIVMLFFLKNEFARKVMFYLAGLAVIISSGFAIADFVTVGTAQSQSVGQIVVEEVNQTTFMTQNYTDMVFYQDTQDASKYYYDDELKAQQFDGTNKDYRILANKMPCSYNECGAGYVQGVFSQTFYSPEGEVNAIVSLTIRIDFYENITRLRITTTKDQDNLTYIEQYIDNNGLKIEVVLFEGGENEQ